MRRRAFLLGFGVVAAVAGFARAEPVMPTVGVVSSGSATSSLFRAPFFRFMKELGWEDGRNFRALYLFAEERGERIPGLVGELVAQHADVIVVFGNDAIAAARRATQTIPIVGVTDDLVGSGFATSMARPGGNVTGVSNFTAELNAKRLAVLHEAVPAAKRIGVLADPTSLSTLLQLEATARDLDLEIVVVTAHNREELVHGLDVLEAAHLDAINVLWAPGAIIIEHQLIIERLNRAHLPAIYYFTEWGKEGALLAYGPPFNLVYHHVVGLIDKILRGARPEDLPIEQPEKIDLVVNLKTAKALGVTIPFSLVARADEVIE
jgi:putative tryptophan/tyrosine transport system substrate-binding protein